MTELRSVPDVRRSCRAALAIALCSTALCTAAIAQRRPEIGATVAELTFTDIRYLERTLADFGERRGFVLFFTTSDCPLARRYLPRVAALEAAHRTDGLQFVAVDVAHDATGDAIRAMATCQVESGGAVVFVRDARGTVARALGVERTATAVVLDAERRIVYRGRVDDQYRLTGVRPEVGRADLAEALSDLREKRPARIAETPVEGCAITAPAAIEPNDATFARDIAPILQRHCQECHRPGGEGPFALLTHEDLTSHAGTIGDVVEDGRMPPWTGSRRHGGFVNERRLSAGERRTLLGYLAGDMPFGDAADLPEPREFPTAEWRIGEPDLVLRVPTPIRVQADGWVPYKYFVLPYRFDEETWVEAIEILPENRRVLHHANLAHFRFGESFSQDGFITGQVPGGDAMMLDPGTAVRIPAGSVLGIQAHYVSTGRDEVDRLRVGLRFPRVPVQQEMHVMIATNTRFAIPPHAAAHEVGAVRAFPTDAVGIGMVSHMHLRGRDMTFRAEYPDGTDELLLMVPNYDFDWQQSYRWERGARRFPKHTRIHVTAHFDNSRFNAFNPDPDQTIRFGQSTLDEMMYGFLFWVAEHERLGIRIDPSTGRALP